MEVDVQTSNCDTEEVEKNNVEDSKDTFKKPLIAPKFTKNKTSLLHKYLQQKQLQERSEGPKENSGQDKISLETNQQISLETNQQISLETNQQISLETNQQISLETNQQISSAPVKKPLKEISCAYKEPPWKSIPKNKYSLEELKSGVIQRTIDLRDKSFILFGRLENCDVAMLHPTVSRHHAVLQYRGISEEDQDEGFYLYDLGSTHGTFLNKNRLKPRIYVRVKVGHVIKIGCSTRLFILQGPPEDEEEESELSVTELKEQRRIELEERKRKEEEEIALAEMAEEKRKKALEERGIDWGMGEDADEETDLSENPFAVTTNEEIYIDDPKKTLRGWFEREGEELTFDIEQADKGSFCCKIVLPIDNGVGRDVVIEVMGKSKKEATIQCALEACRHIDRQGLLRQSHHEARKRQTKNWEENDYYDSDEDNFLDRTGQIERKREKRMRKMGKIQETVETYESLMEKHNVVVDSLNKAEGELMNLRRLSQQTSEGLDENMDALDAFMQNLKKKCPSKLEIKMCQQEVNNLKDEEERLRQLINIAKPANLPELKPVVIVPTAGSKQLENKNEAKSSHVVDDEIKLSEKVISSDMSSQKQDSERISKIGPLLPTEEEIQEIEKKKKRSRPRNRQKTQKESEPSSFEDEYNNCVWKPPEGQTGDGRTSLNDKLGY